MCRLKMIDWLLQKKKKITSFNLDIWTIETLHTHFKR